VYQQELEGNLPCCHKKCVATHCTSCNSNTIPTQDDDTILLVYGLVERGRIGERGNKDDGCGPHYDDDDDGRNHF